MAWNGFLMKRIIIRRYRGCVSEIIFVAIESVAELLCGGTNILYITVPTLDEINHIPCGTSDVGFDGDGF